MCDARAQREGGDDCTTLEPREVGCQHGQVGSGKFCGIVIFTQCRKRSQTFQYMNGIMDIVKFAPKIKSFHRTKAYDQSPAVEVGQKARVRNDVKLCKNPIRQTSKKVEIGSGNKLLAQNL